MSIARTTELEAVNTMLSVIGESPVSSLVNNLNVDAVMAKSLLTEELRALQAEGWQFNREYNYPLAPNNSGEILVPANCISVDLDERRYWPRNYDVILRGNRLYNKVKHTYVFTETLYGDLTFLLEFSEIPEAARQYVMIRAARKLQDRVIGDRTLSGFNRADEVRARATLVSEDSRGDDLNILKNWSIQQTTRRM